MLTRMVTRTLVTAALAFGAVLTAASGASANTPDDPYGFNAIRDRTDYFVAPFDPGALVGANAHKPIILSPYGARHKIECRGDGHYVSIHDCVQYDTNGVAHELRLLANPIRPVYVYI
ncbi:Uncharacterised protein [Rhodococcus coprophilus]|uniref:Uncharacterized protein n=2 Tax=Rhodococcus coprophilus TaxID=38310 RepID=A0A2X4U2N1_9NOCA|nr:Uncharacterised protein [Rhodococcus coprophilus]